MANRRTNISGAENIQKKLNKVIADFANQTTMNKLGLLGVRTMKKRTREGRDVYGKPFKPYSAQHADRRAMLHLPTNVVNLQMNDIDGMMNSVDYDVSTKADSVSFFLNRPEKEELMRIHSFLGAGKSKVIRKAWGFSNKEKQHFIKKVAIDLKNLIIADLRG